MMTTSWVRLSGTLTQSGLRRPGLIGGGQPFGDDAFQAAGLRGGEHVAAVDVGEMGGYPDGVAVEAEPVE